MGEISRATMRDVIARIIDLVPRKVPKSILPAGVGGLSGLPPSVLRTAVVSIAIAAAGLVAVGALWLASAHTPGDTVFYPYFDKRWIIALYALGVVLVYVPPATKQWFDRIGGTAGTATQVTRGAALSVSTARLVCVVIVGFGFALVDIGPRIPETLERVWEAHELVHLGPFQRIADGGIPYVEAQTQYGPGHQLISYLMMRDTEFTLRGFRASFFALNLLAEGLWFSLMLGAFGWSAGLAAIVFSRLFCPFRLLTFVGWYIEFRWLGPFLIGVPLALILWTECRPATRFAFIAALGCFGGLLAWFSQENLMTIMGTVGLIVLAGFARGRVLPGSALAALGVFALCHILMFLTLLAAGVGLEHLQEALRLYSRTGSLWLKGLANTPWSPTAWRPDGNVFTPAFYATPYAILVCGALTIWAPRGRTAVAERNLAVLLATAAATASLVPLMLLRSDEPHFLGPATILPALLVFAIATLPKVWATRRGRRATLRCAAAAVLLLIFVAPLGLQNIISRLTSHFGLAWQGAQALADILEGAPQVEQASKMERRSGFRMVAGGGSTPMGRDQPCYYYFAATCGEVSELIDEIREKIGERTVFLHVGTGAVSSPVYFFGDLNVQVSKPELISTVWVQKDLDELRAELRKSPPDCVINWGHGTETGLLLRLYGHYTSTAIRDGVIYCRS